MSRLVKQLIALLVLVAHVGAAPPAVADGEAPVPDQSTEPRGCCDTDADPGDCAPPPDSGGCCPDSCQHCPLSCCGGSPAVAGRPPTDLTGPANSRAVFLAPRACPPGIDPHEIYHPPRD